MVMLDDLGNEAKYIYLWLIFQIRHFKSQVPSSLMAQVQERFHVIGVEV